MAMTMTMMMNDTCNLDGMDMMDMSMGGMKVR